MTYIMANISLEYPDITEERIYDYYTLIEDEDPAEEYSDLSACSNVEEAVSELKEKVLVLEWPEGLVLERP